MSGQPAGSWRISDADRLAAVQALGEHYATGRIDKAEYDERSDRVMVARTPTELHPVFADLPLPHGRLVATVRERAPVAQTRPVARRRGFGPGPWLLLLIAVLFVVVHAPFLLIVVLALVVLSRRRGHRWAHRRPIR